MGGVPGNDGSFFAIDCIFPPFSPLHFSRFSPQGGSGGKKKYKVSKKVRVCFEDAAGNLNHQKEKKKKHSSKCLKRRFQSSFITLEG